MCKRSVSSPQLLRVLQRQLFCQRQPVISLILALRAVNSSIFIVRHVEKDWYHAEEESELVRAILAKQTVQR